MSLEWKCADSNGGLQCTFVTRILRLCMRLLATRQAAHRIDNQFTPMLTLYEQTVGFALESWSQIGVSMGRRGAACW